MFLECPVFLFSVFLASGNCPTQKPWSGRWNLDLADKTLIWQIKPSPGTWNLGGADGTFMGQMKPTRGRRSLDLAVQTLIWQIKPWSGRSNFCAWRPSQTNFRWNWVPQNTKKSIGKTTFCDMVNSGSPNPYKTCRKWRLLGPISEKWPGKHQKSIT